MKYNKKAALSQSVKISFVFMRLYMSRLLSQLMSCYVCMLTTYPLTLLAIAFYEMATYKLLRYN